MIKEEIIERVVKETKITLYCDVINILTENEPCGRIAKRKCQNCGIHICNAHSKEEDNSGDYPSYFCSKCYPKYRHWKDDIEPMFEKQMEEEYERIMRNTTHNSSLAVQAENSLHPNADKSALR